MLKQNKLSQEDGSLTKEIELKQFPVSLFNNFPKWLMECLFVFGFIIIAILIVCAVCVFLLYAPLGLIGFENLISGTNHTEDFLQANHLVGPLGKFYYPVINSSIMYKLRPLFHFLKTLLR